ncbi:MAG: hypothetical protein ACRCUS_09635 [Anaerovoracaceae bacterium]
MNSQQLFTFLPLIFLLLIGGGIACIIIFIVRKHFKSQEEIAKNQKEMIELMKKDKEKGGENE